MPVPTEILLPSLMYVGPDQILPLTTALGAITGFLMLFWTRLRAYAQRVTQMFSRKANLADSESDPKAP